MATFYLKNTTASTVTIDDLGVSLPAGKSMPIDSNSINGYLTTNLADALNAGDLVLSPLDFPDTTGLPSGDAIAALEITSRYDRDNPHQTTIHQAITADAAAGTVTFANLATVTDGSEADLMHKHDTRYWTKTQLGADNHGTVAVNWANVTNAPSFGAVQWQEPVICNLWGMAATPPSTPFDGMFYVNTNTNHLWKRVLGSWADQGAPTAGDRVIFRDGTDSDDKVYTFSGTAWAGVAPVNSWALLVHDDGDGRAAEYVYDQDGSPPDWIKIADVNWGDHRVMSHRDEPDSHPSTAITYDGTASHLAATTVQDAIDELVAGEGVAPSNYLYVAKNGSDSNSDPNVVLGTIETPYRTIGAALAAVPTSGPTAASSTNRYMVIVLPGDYAENVSLTTAWAYVRGEQRNATRLVSASGDTVLLSNLTEGSTGISNMTIVSNSSTASDSAISVTGNRPLISNVKVFAPSGARTLYVNGAFNQQIDTTELNGGTFRIDAGTTTFYNSKVVSATTDVESGSLRIVNGDFSSSGDAIVQNNGTVYLVSAKLSSGSSSKDYNQGGGTVYWGWVEFDHTKTTFSGTKNLLFKAVDEFYSNAVSGLAAANVQDAIDEVRARSSAQLTPYIVGKDSFDPYSSIQAAITQAVADGHNFANPCVVMVKPGTYTEDVVAQPGVNVVSLMNDKSYQTRVSGTLTYDSAAGGTVGSKITTWLGIDVTSGGVSGPTLSFTGANPQRLNITNCEVNSSGANSALAMDNTGAASVLVANHVNFNNTSSGPAARIDRGTLALDGTQTNAASGASIQLSNAAQLQGQNNYATGPLSFAGTSGGLFRDLTVSNGTANAVDFTSTGYLYLVDAIQLGTGTLVGGSHADHVVVRHNAKDVPYDNSVSGISATNVQDAIDAEDSRIDTDITNLSTHTGNHANPHEVTLTQAITADSASVPELSTLNLDTLVDASNADALHGHAASNITFDNGPSGLVATSVQGAVDEIVSHFGDLLPKGTTFPADPGAGDLFYRTDLNLTFQYDGSRSKWLSVSQMFLDWGSNNADGVYLNIHGAVATQTGYLMPKNGTILSVTAVAASGNNAKGLEIRKNHVGAALKSFALSSFRYTSTNDSVDFLAGDYLQMYAVSSQTPARDVVVMITVAWSFPG